jgi:hypothetical protein
LATVLIIGRLPCFSPLGAVLDNPIGQSSFESDVLSFFLGLDPFVPQNFFALGLKLAVKGRVFYQIIAVGIVRVTRHKIRYRNVTIM